MLHIHDHVYLQVSYYPPILHSICYPTKCITYHGLFASTFKDLTGLPLLILLTRHGKTGVWRRVRHRRRTCELGRFPVRMPVGVGWWHGHPLSPKISAIRCISVFCPYKPYPSELDLTSHVMYYFGMLDVRLLIFGICVFGEHWSLGSLSTFIRRSRLVSWGPHRAGAILTIGSLR